MRNFAFVFVSLFAFSTFSFSQPTQTKEKLTCIDKKFSVVVHIVKDSLHKANVSESTIIAAIAGASQQFAPICVSFQVCEIRYIDNYAYDDIDMNKDFPEMQHQYNLKNRINIYYVQSFTGGGAAAGFASLGGITNMDSLGICIKKGSASSAGVMAHEMGHYWGLYHTFEKAANGPELANGSNCATSGDLVCDTPADPYDPAVGADAYREKAPSCLFTYMGKDANNQYYDPHTSNIMNYYECPCSGFTDGQFQRMVSIFLSNPKMW